MSNFYCETQADNLRNNYETQSLMISNRQCVLNSIPTSTVIDSFNDGDIVRS